MNNSGLHKLLICVSLSLLAGCAENSGVRPTKQTCLSASPTPSVADATSAAEQVLAQMHFTIEKLDAQAGYIKTNPLAGAQSIEPWRSDSAGLFNRMEADLHTIRRTIELNITRQADRICIDCRATTQRLSMPNSPVASDRGYTAISESYRAYHKPGFEAEQKSSMTWIDLGRYGQLETEIIKRIEKQLTSSKPVLSATEGKGQKK
jgi:hypothetical protein